MMASSTAKNTVIGTSAIMASLVCTNLGAALAKNLFAVVGAPAVAFLRVSLACMLIMILRRPWRRTVPAQVRVSLLGYGLMLGLMNLAIYQAFARLPIGIAIGIEVTGPLAIVLLGSRKPGDFLWLGLAAAGLVLLLPLRAEGALDVAGIGYAAIAAACWALYIVFGKRVSSILGADAVAWGLLLSTFVILPFGVSTGGLALMFPSVLGVGLLVAIVSSALPYTLEMAALVRLPAHLFGIMLSASPAIGAIAGFVVLGERLTRSQWLAVVFIMAASAGSAFSAVTKSKPVTLQP